jgi:hypothetical protein
MQDAEPDLGIDVSGARTDPGLLDVGALLVSVVGGSPERECPKGDESDVIGTSRLAGGVIVDDSRPACGPTLKGSAVAVLQESSGFDRASGAGGGATRCRPAAEWPGC